LTRAGLLVPVTPASPPVNRREPTPGSFWARKAPDGADRAHRRRRDAPGRTPPGPQRGHRRGRRA